ncbi:hypothetical protein ABZP36_030849, partial [Zizania latifolia]
MGRCGGGGGHGRQLLLLAVLACSWVAPAEAQPQRAAPRTDPVEAAALNAILRRWRTTPPTTWNISGEPCSGTAVDETDINIIDFGIKCDCSFNNGTVCRIVRLKVYRLDVVGQIPEELQNLTHLIHLNLGMNYLTGSLPAFIGELTALQYLSLGVNALTGVLPRELGNLKNLTSLSISTNKFVGPLPEVLENLTKLEQ